MITTTLHISLFDNDTKRLVYVNPKWVADPKDPKRFLGFVEIQSDNEDFPTFEMPMDFAYNFGEALIKQVRNMASLDDPNEHDEEDDDE